MATSSGQPRIAIIGAGVSGIAMGHALRQRGITSFEILEKATAVGGTWHHHGYPGLCIDVKSHLYSFSFDLNPDWTSNFPARAEIEAYVQGTVDRIGLAPFIKVGCEVVTARYLEDRREWELAFADGRTARYNFVIGALGVLTMPVLPEIPGRASFAGASWHSARWNSDYDFTGKRVAVVGSAASAIQIVPELARLAASVTIFQRTPNWVRTRGNFDYSARARKIFRRLPFAMRLYRWLLYCETHLLYIAYGGNKTLLEASRRNVLDEMEKHIADPALRAALTPDYDPGCKRMLVSDDFYPTLALDHVRLVTDSISHIGAEGIVTGNGKLHEADVIIYCTGYKTPNLAGTVDVIGTGEVHLAKAMEVAPEAYRGLSVPGFPNYFMMNGPNGALGYTSVILSSELQAGYIARTLARVWRRGLRSIDADVLNTKVYNERMDREGRRMTWAGKCRSYYHDDTGRAWFFYPGSAPRMWWDYLTARLDDYVTSR